MRYFNNEDKWQELLEKFSDKKKINKGIRFENLEPVDTILAT